jgi:glycopeptide antibiotics resistance protein
MLLTGMVTAYYHGQGKLFPVQSIVLMLLTTYIFLVFTSTVFSRAPKDCYDYELIPFWSYWEIWKGEKSLFWEDVFNVIMLFPIGVLLPIVLEPVWKDGRKKTFMRVVLTGFLTSLSIEILQLVTKRGLFEFDDMFHNTLGVVIGYWIYQKFRSRLLTREKKHIRKDF